jgi:hypothetical protein
LDLNFNRLFHLIDLRGLKPTAKDSLALNNTRSLGSWIDIWRIGPWLDVLVSLALRYIQSNLSYLLNFCILFLELFLGRFLMLGLSQRWRRTQSFSLNIAKILLEPAFNINELRRRFVHQLQVFIALIPFNWFFGLFHSDLYLRYGFLKLKPLNFFLPICFHFYEFILIPP